jgi:hypothetical protein
MKFDCFQFLKSVSLNMLLIWGERRKRHMGPGMGSAEVDAAVEWGIWLKSGVQFGLIGALS